MSKAKITEVFTTNSSLMVIFSPKVPEGDLISTKNVQQKDIDPLWETYSANGQPLNFWGLHIYNRKNKV